MSCRNAVHANDRMVGTLSVWRSSWRRSSWPVTLERSAAPTVPRAPYATTGPARRFRSLTLGTSIMRLPISAPGVTGAIRRRTT